MKGSNFKPAHGLVSKLMDGLRAVTSNSSNTRPELGDMYFSTESGDSSDLEVSNAKSSIRAEIETIAKQHGLSFEGHEYDQAAISAILQTNPNSVTRNGKLNVPTGVADLGQIASSTQNTSFSRALVGESYNESDIDIYQRAGIVMTLMASQQTPFAKMFFQPKNLDPREAGIVTPVTSNYIYNDFYHSTDGSLVEAGRKLVVRGFVSPKILKNRLTELVPVYRAKGNSTNVNAFVEDSMIEPVEAELGGGVKILTSMLKTGVEHNIISLSQTNQSLNHGLADSTYIVSEAMYLKELLVSFGDDHFVVDTRGLPGSVFDTGVQGEKRKTHLKFDTNSVVIPAGALTTKGKEAEANAILKDYNIRLKFYVTGDVDLSEGTTRINQGGISLHAATDVDGNPVTAAVFKQLSDVVKAGQIPGFTIDARLENRNLAQNGLLTETKTHRLLVTVPYREAVSNVSSTYDQEHDFDGSLAGIITLHRIKADGEAIDTIHEWAERLSNYKAVVDQDGQVPFLDTVGSRAGIIPTWHEAEIDAEDLVDGFRSAHRFEDIKAALLGHVHLIAMNLIVNSEYLPVVRSYGADENFKPKVVVGTDQILYSYLSTAFAEEVEHEEYTIEFQPTMNETMRGVVYIGITDPTNDATDGIIKPSVWGNFIHSPEMVSRLPKSRGNTTSNYLTSTPRYRHIVNVPVLGRITVKNVQKLADRLRILTDSNVQIEGGAQGGQTGNP